MDPDVFGIENLESTRSDELKNCSTKSLVLAPFNSTESDDEGGNGDEDFLANLIKANDNHIEMLIKTEVFNFDKKAKRADIFYERDHNRILDNGVYKNDEKDKIDDFAEMLGANELEIKREPSDLLSNAGSFMGNKVKIGRLGTEADNRLVEVMAV